VRVKHTIKIPRPKPNLTGNPNLKTQNHKLEGTNGRSNFFKDESGASAVDGLLVSLIACVIVLAVGSWAAP
jgi:hypothetical protein